MTLSSELYGSPLVAAGSTILRPKQLSSNPAHHAGDNNRNISERDGKVYQGASDMDLAEAQPFALE